MTVRPSTSARFDWQVLPQTTPVSMARQSVQKASKQSKAKSANPGRTYTSKYRGVHQTFPTKRWEAQFRSGRLHALCRMLRQLGARRVEQDAWPGCLGDFMPCAPR